VLLGTSHAADAPIAGPAGLSSHGVHVETGAEATAIDRISRTVLLGDGRQLPYDALVLATGAIAREIPQLPKGTPRVHYLRNETDAAHLKAALDGSRSVLVVGAGLIGLEVAASAATLGLETTVLEMAPCILGRVCDSDTSARVLEAHRQHGVDVRVGMMVAAATADGAGRTRVVTSSGDILEADLVVVGTGAQPSDRLAAAAGLETNDGLIIDEYCRTSDPSIYAAGDVTRFPGPDGLVRLENWRHAQDQGAIAGRNAAGANERYTAVPSFWSEQYDLYVQGVGWGLWGAHPVSRSLAANSALVFHVRDGRVVYAMGINAQRDIATARRLIERQVPVDASALADSRQPLTAMLKR
jgi:NADPH-dependent 2,4-dienoyl-CoA reductase/sulfur reductase-like enzyme